MHYFSIFFKKFKNHAFIFDAFGQKTQIVGKFSENFENSIEKLHFLLYLENLLLKIEPSEITPCFYNNFFGFWRGEFPPLPPKSAYD